MKLIALITIINGTTRVAPGGPIDVPDREGEALLSRQFARHPTDGELAQHWPLSEAESAALAEAEAAARAQAEAQAKAEAEAAAKTAAEAEEAIKAAAKAESAAKPAAKTAKAKAGNG